MHWGEFVWLHVFPGIATVIVISLTLFIFFDVDESSERRWTWMEVSLQVYYHEFYLSAVLLRACSQELNRWLFAVSLALTSRSNAIDDRTRNSADNTSTVVCDEKYMDGSE